MKQADKKQTAGDIMRQMLKDERQGIIAFHQQGETKVNCAACTSSESDVGYIIACLLHELAPTFNTTPIHLAAVVVDALDFVVGLPNAEQEK